MDTNNDGIGDIQGIINKLDYLKDLGIDILWISPMYQSPMVDNGYDISDYYAIDPMFGSMDDMKQLIAEAKKRDMYILMDLVVNHCSSEHEWFQKAMQDPDGEYGAYFYIKDGDTVWNPGWKPCKTPLDSYECRHGMNYTRITGSKNGVEASVLFFVPLHTWAEVQKMTLKNQTEEVKTLKVFSFAEWCLWNAATDMENFQRNFSTGEVEVEGSTIYHKTEYRERRNHQIKTIRIILQEPVYCMYRNLCRQLNRKTIYSR